MRIACIALAALATTIAVTPAQAKVISISPSSQWNVDFGENKCRLARLFGEGEQRHLVFFEQYWPGRNVGLTVAGAGVTRFRGGQRTDLRFREDQMPLRTQPFTGDVGEYGSAVIYSSVNIETGIGDEPDESENQPAGLTLLDTDDAKAVQFVGLKQRGDETRLLTGPLDEAFAVLNQCTLDLVKDWGLDPEQQRTARQMPRWTNMDAIVRRIQAVYPRKALNRGEQAIMRMRVIVTAQGTVESCAIIKATDTEKLESPACKVMQDAAFEPGLDAVGQPMRSLYVNSITYQLG